jgi:tetratricopeptide (TPR) repeat protein
MTHSIRLLAALCCLTLATAAGAQTNNSNNDAAELAFERGRLMVQSHRFREASALWDSIARLNVTPDYKAKYLAINGVLHRDSLRDTTLALRYFQRAEALYPSIKQMRTKEVETSVIYASMGLGAYADSLSQYSTAITHYDKAIDLTTHLLQEGIRGFDMSDFDLTVRQYSFELCRAVDYGHVGQFEDAEVAFEQLQYNYGMFELSPDPEIKMQGWLFGSLSRQQYILMLERDKNDTEHALQETNSLLDKLLSGLSSGDTTITEGLAYQMPMFLYHAARINLKAGDPEQAIKLCGNALLWTSDDEWKPAIINVKGEALLKQRKKEEARQCWEEVKQLAPGFYNAPKGTHPLQDKFGKK